MRRPGRQGEGEQGAQDEAERSDRAGVRHRGAAVGPDAASLAAAAARSPCSLSSVIAVAIGMRAMPAPRSIQALVVSNFCF